jgi:oxygen-independent coproporphyrinogen-3 oxidase
LTDSLGVYISVPFCKAKCTYCNFASGVFAADRMDRYIDTVCAEVRGVRTAAEQLGANLPRAVDTIFFGGGTPSLLGAEQMRRLFAALKAEFAVSPAAEVTLECAPGQLGEGTLQEMLRQGLNRVSFGVQSFVDAEARAVGRLHTRKICLDEIARLRSAGVDNINVDLIAGLPGQTAASWRESLEVVLETRVPHVSIYMLEVDEDSRLGREVLGAGTRYGADAVPTEDETAEWYAAACEWLEADGVRQYEISNFARMTEAGDADSHQPHAEAISDYRSRHNIKYWRRQNYVGFGLDAHSMLRCGQGAVRWANCDDLATYELRRSGAEPPPAALMQLAHAAPPAFERIGLIQAFEEAIFLGMRMNQGVQMESLRAEFGDGLLQGAVEALEDVIEAGMVVVDEGRMRLTARGRMASNEVFSRLLVGAAV